VAPREAQSPTILSLDINNEGQAVIALHTYETPGVPGSKVFIWDVDTGAATELDLDLPPDMGITSAGINERGQVIVGAVHGYGVDQVARTYLWDGERVVDFGPYALDEPGLYAWDSSNRPYNRNSKPLNDLGHVAFQRTTAGGEQHAHLWSDGQTTDLGTLGGDYSVALAVNDRDEVVGQSRTADGELHAFVWRDGRMTDLGALAGGGESAATQINDAGQILGARTNRVFTAGALLWSPTPS
jgi:probable HAF family extracellular repeat protein